MNITIMEVTRFSVLVAPPLFSNLMATNDCFNHFRISWSHNGDTVNGYNITLMHSNAVVLTDVTSDNYYSYV